MASETYPRGEQPRISDFSFRRWIMRSTRTVRKRILLPGDRLNKEKYRKRSVDYFVPQVRLVCPTEREIINEIALNTAKYSVSCKKKL